MMGKSEIAFGKLGYLRKENENIIVYYRPYTRNDIRHDDITFCKHTNKIVLYQGTNFGPDAFRMDCNLIKAIKIQCDELGWFKK